MIPTPSPLHLKLALKCVLKYSSGTRVEELNRAKRLISGIEKNVVVQIPADPSFVLSDVHPHPQTSYVFRAWWTSSTGYVAGSKSPPVTGGQRWTPFLQFFKLRALTIQ